MGKLTTHVLDTAKGKPAQGLKIDLLKSDALFRSVVTNSDGRVDGAVLEGEELTIGHYEFRFYAGDYLRRTNSGLKEPLFLDVIPVRFGIADAALHYHVPLLFSLFSFSTYRGS